MPFTDAQRDQIMRYLGYPALAAGTRYAGYYPIYSQIDLVGGDPVTQAPVEAILAELVTVDVAIAAGGSAAGAGTYGALKKVDEVEFYSAKDSLLQSSDVITAMKRAHMLVRRLAQRMGGEKFILADYFATGSAAGDVGGSGLMSLG